MKNNKQPVTHDEFSVNFSTRVLIDDPDTNEVYLDKSNAIHSQNMARTIARALSNEDNSIIYRIAFGNGGSFTDAAENIVLNPPNDGSGGEGWESRLYNETYSEIVSGPLVGQDPGSVGPANTRIGGGAVPEEDSPANSVISVEVGRKSNVIASVMLNRSEPITQLPSTSGQDTIALPEEGAFNFDELGFYTPGKGAAAKPATLQLDVGGENSDSLLPPSVPRDPDTLSINMEIDGVQNFTTITIPSGGGSGPSGEITFGDLCEGFNTGAWLSGSPINESVELLISNNSTTTTYPSILGAETFGNLLFRTTESPGPSKSLVADCISGSFFEELGILGCASITETPGDSVGVLNDPATPSNERERLLTHITFPPILKKANRSIRIRYILTVSVAQVSDTVVEME